jgi:hypothetical protein
MHLISLRCTSAGTGRKFKNKLISANSWLAERIKF